MHVTGHTTSGKGAAPHQGQRGTAGIRYAAQTAGVSCRTVPRVVNGRANVRRETRERVEAAVQGLGFRRNATAFALACGAMWPRTA